MDTTQELMELEFLSGQVESADLFTDAYEKLLHECQVSRDKVTLRKMRKILQWQELFLIQEWRREKGFLPREEQRVNVQ